MRKENKSYNTLTQEEILNSLKELKLAGLALAYMEQEKSPKTQQLSFNDRFGMLLYEEISGRKQKRRTRLFKESGLKGRLYGEYEMIYNSQRNLDKGLVEELMSCRWIEQENPPHLVITGSAGTGKTYLAEAFGKESIKRLHSVVYMRFPQLLEKMMQAHINSESASLRKKINTKELLIIDDFGMASLNEQMRTDFLSLIDDRLGVGATIIAAQLPFKQWYKFIGEAYNADALIDRIKNHSYMIELKGPSLRELKNKK